MGDETLDDVVGGGDTGDRRKDLEDFLELSLGELQFFLQ